MGLHKTKMCMLLFRHARYNSRGTCAAWFDLQNTIKLTVIVSLKDGIGKQVNISTLLYSS